MKNSMASVLIAKLRQSLRSDGLRAKEVCSLTIVIALLAAIEVIGRASRTELWDLLMAMLLVALVGTCIELHRNWNLAWTKPIARFLVASLRRFRGLQFELGVDLRRAPPIPRGIPVALLILPTSLVVLTAAALGWILWLAVPFRDVATQVSYVAYVAGLIGLWTALIFTIFMMAVLPVLLLFDTLIVYTSLTRSQARPWVSTMAGVYLASLLVCGVVLPSWVAAVVLACALPLGATLTWFPPWRQLDCLWKDRAGSDIRSISWTTFSSLTEVVCIPLTLIVLVLFALGPAAFGLPSPPSPQSGFFVRLWVSPISTLLGQLGLWVFAPGAILTYVLSGNHGIVARRHDPQRPAPLGVYVDAARQLHPQLADQFRSRGWNVRFAPARPRRTDVRIRVDGADFMSETEFDPTFDVAQEDLHDSQTVDRIARRDVIQRRRLLVRGLQTIFRRAASRPVQDGNGYWVAPQYWFAPGLTRDGSSGEHTEVLQVVPPLYHRVLPHAVRHHFLEICSALQVDLIFVEDGVGFRGLRRVLRVLFEQYDMHEGRQRAQEIHFAGLPKIRVIFHEYELAKSWEKSRYPEPDYSDLGRARILHVFRDRGDDEEEALDPTDFDFLLSPVGSPAGAF